MMVAMEVVSVMSSVVMLMLALALLCLLKAVTSKQTVLLTVLSKASCPLSEHKQWTFSHPSTCTLAGALPTSGSISP